MRATLSSGLSFPRTGRGAFAWPQTSVDLAHQCEPHRRIRFVSGDPESSLLGQAAWLARGSVTLCIG